MHFLFQVFIFCFSSRSDITVMVDWVQDTRLLTYHFSSAKCVDFFVCVVETSLILTCFDFVLNASQEALA